MRHAPLLATLTLTATLALTGCGSSGDSTADGYIPLTGADASIAEHADDYTPAPAYTPPAPAPAPVDTGDSTDLAFELTLRNQGLIPTYGGVSDSIALAHSMCEVLDAGGTEEDVTGVLIGNGYPFDDAYFFYGVATSAYCPEQG